MLKGVKPGTVEVKPVLLGWVGTATGVELVSPLDFIAGLLVVVVDFLRFDASFRAFADVANVGLAIVQKSP